MIADEFLQKLAELSDEDERNWLALSDLLSALPSEISQAVIAASITHWFDSQILASLLLESATKSETIYQSLLNLPFVETFVDFGSNIHEQTRHLILGHLWENNRDDYISLSKRAAQYFDENRYYPQRTLKVVEPQRQIEYIYHLLITNLASGIEAVRYQGNEWLRSFEFPLVIKLTRVIREHAESNRIEGTARGWGLYWEGMVAFNTKQTSEAISTFEQILSSYQDDELLRKTKSKLSKIHKSLSDNTSTKVRVAILDDHVAIVEGYKKVLSKLTQIEVVGAAFDGQELELLLSQHSVDVLITGINQPISQSNRNVYPILAVIPKLLLIYPNLSILVVTMMNEAALMNAIIDAGASGYILKDDMASFQNFAEIVLHIASGGIYMSEEAHKRLHQRKEKEEILTKRQIEVVALCASYPEKSTAELASKLNVTDSTFRNLLTSAYMRLGVRNRSAAIVKVRQLGLAK